MARKPLKPPRMTVADMVEELREAATDPDIDTPEIPPEETLEGEVTQTLEEFEAALTLIAQGGNDPQRVAREALSLTAPLKPIAATEDFLRDLLKPRSE